MNNEKLKKDEKKQQVLAEAIRIAGFANEADRGTVALAVIESEYKLVPR